MDTSSSVCESWAMTARVLIRCFWMCMVLLTVWIGIILLAGDLVYRLHAAFFDITPRQFDFLHYGLIGLVKILAICLFLFPYLAIQWVRRVDGKKQI